MKTIILMTLFLGLFSMNCFSQEKNKLIIDSSFLDFTMSPNIKFSKTFNFNVKMQIKNPIGFDKYLKISDLKVSQSHDIIKNLALTNSKYIFDNMPIFIPKTNNIMPIFEPDLTSRQTLLIRKID